MQGIRFRREIGIGEILATITLLLTLATMQAATRERLARIEARVDALAAQVNRTQQTQATAWRTSTLRER
jgi:hypothetical protein